MVCAKNCGSLRLLGFLTVVLVSLVSVKPHQNESLFVGKPSHIARGPQHEIACDMVVRWAGNCLLSSVRNLFAVSAFNASRSMWYWNAVVKQRNLPVG